jgi:hypothetical protein
MPMKPEELQLLKRDRGIHISRTKALQVKTALEPYTESGQTNDLESALRNFLIDFLHLTGMKGPAMSAEKLMVIVSQAVELHSAESGSKRVVQV